MGGKGSGRTGDFSETVVARVTPAQKKKIVARAKAVGMTVSEWVRALIVGGK